MGTFGTRRIFLFSLVASVSVSALIGIGVLIFGDFGGFEIRILMTTLAVTTMSILGLACGAYLETGRGRVMPLAGIVLSVIAALMCFFIIWNVLDDNWYFIKSFLTATLLAAACSHLSLLSLARLDRRFATVRTMGYVCVSSLCAILLYILWTEPEASDSIVTRILGVLAILVATITIVTPVLHKLSSDETNVAKIDAEIEVLKERIAELELRRSATGSGSNDLEAD